MRRKKSLVQIIMLCIIGFAVAMIAIYIYVKPILIKKTLPKPIIIDTKGQPTLGNPKAKIHMVVFEDLKCGNCARFDVTVASKIKKEFVDTGIATYTMINVAFVPGSMPAANAARCVYKQHHALFFNYVDYLFQHQPPEDQNWATIPALMIDASKIKGIDLDQLSRCLIENPYDQFIQHNLKIASKAMGKQVSTPTLYINGIKVDPLTKKQIYYVMKALQ